MSEEIRLTDVDIAIVPEYPFSLDSEANAVKNIGVLNPGSTATKEFSPFRRQKCPERNTLSYYPNKAR